MTEPRRIMQADVVIAGSGSGGATMARELSKKGKKVILREAGKYQERFGYSPFLLTIEVDELYEEVPIQPLPDSRIGPAARQIMQSAQDIGLDWNPIDKWIRADSILQ